MTSEAKIGLLLGLVVIVIIALVVHGLPSFHKNDTSNDSTDNTITLGDNPGALGQQEREVSRVIRTINEQTPSGPGGLTAPDPQLNSDVRSILAAPQTVPNNPQTAPAITTTQTPSGSTPTVIIGSQPQTQVSTTSRITQTATQSANKSYTVKSGDNLASIAIQFYGQSEGNRLVNIDRIFNANKNILKAKDEIFEGQKIVIPPLPASETASSSTTSKSSTNTANTNFVGPVQPSNEYVVADGDNLWNIAASRLGNGTRYTEIVKLNPVLEGNVNNIKAGMKLKMPAK